MAGSKCDYLADALIDLVLGAVSWTPPATIYWALSTAAFDPSATGSAMDEHTGSGYARVAKTNNKTNFTSSSPGTRTVSVAQQVLFPTATGAWSTVMSIYVTDALTGGNCLWGADLDNPTSVAMGSALIVPVSGGTFTER